MHHIYTTPGFIVHSMPHGESGKFFLIFTKDFGMIGATAQGIRLSQSKLRYHIQDNSLSNISIVRGKEVWRIVGVGEVEQVKTNKVHIQILKLLKRFLHGEEKNEKLFEVVEALYKNDFEKINTELVESLVVLRILNHLGYISNKEIFNDLISNNTFGKEIIDKVKEQKAVIIKEINRALKESQL